MTRLYLATDDALVVLTVGEDCRRCDLHLGGRRAQCIAIDPLREAQVYCGTFGNGLWRSDDAGRNWQPAGRGIAHAKVYSVAVSRSERVGGRGVVYAGTGESAFFRCEDGGATWHACTSLVDLPSSSEWSFPPRPDTHHARWIHLDPHLGGRLLVAVEAGALVRSFDGGRTWSDRVPTGPIDTHQLVAPREFPERLYSAAGDGYFESDDRGETWRRVEDGLAHRYVWSVAVDPGNAGTRIVASAASARHSHFEEDAESFIYRRTADTPWQQVHAGLPAPSGRRTALLAAHPRSHGVFFAAWEQDVFRSTDAGKSWQRFDVPWPPGFNVGEPRALGVADDD